MAFAVPSPRPVASFYSYGRSAMRYEWRSLRNSSEDWPQLLCLAAGPWLDDVEDPDSAIPPSPSCSSSCSSPLSYRTRHPPPRSISVRAYKVRAYEYEQAPRPPTRRSQAHPRKLARFEERLSDGSLEGTRMWPPARRRAGWRTHWDGDHGFSFNEVRASPSLFSRPCEALCEPAGLETIAFLVGPLPLGLPSMWSSLLGF